MISAFEHVAGEYGIGVEELTLWVERRWVRPDRQGGEIVFTEIDRARLRMIVEFRRDLAIDEEAMPVVLDLLDRLHAARDHLRVVMLAVADLPESAQIALFRRLHGETDT